MKYHRLYSRVVDKTTGVISDQAIAPGKHLVFLTNNCSLSTAMIAALYKKRWAVELFFKWIKQNLRIKHFMARRRTR